MIFEGALIIIHSFKDSKSRKWSQKNRIQFARGAKRINTYGCTRSFRVCVVCQDHPTRVCVAQLLLFPNSSQQSICVMCHKSGNIRVCSPLGCSSSSSHCGKLLEYRYWFESYLCIYLHTCIDKFLSIDIGLKHTCVYTYIHAQVACDHVRSKKQER